MAGISRSRWRRASWLCLTLAACGGRAARAGNGPAPEAERVIPLARAIVLGTTGAPPADTTVTFATGATRIIVMRHGPPDNVVFAELAFPPTAFATDSGREVRVEVRPQRGVYAMDINLSLPLRQGAGATVTFKYARYFAAPARARSVYRTNVGFESALRVGRLQPDGMLTLLPSTRPASDNLRAPLSTPGRYLVAAPDAPAPE